MENKNCSVGINDGSVIERLLKCFPNSFINQKVEFIAHKEANEYFILEDCKNEFDIKCKCLEYLSRASFKSRPFKSDKKNKDFQKFISKGINKYLGTDFDENNMADIYCYLGNGVNHDKTVAFIESDYNFDILSDSTYD